MTYYPTWILIHTATKVWKIAIQQFNTRLKTQKTATQETEEKEIYSSTRMQATHQCCQLYSSAAKNFHQYVYIIYFSSQTDNINDIARSEN